MIHLVTFASDDMSISAQRCVDSAKRMGVDSTTLMRPSDCNDLEKTQRGYGFWKWKPMILNYALSGRDVGIQLEDGDILIYSDAGVEFLEPVQTVIDRMDQDVFLFGNEHEHAHWCKRDIVNEVWPSLARNSHDAWLRFGNQVQASVIFFRVNDYTRRFVKEWLDWCLFEGGRLIDDSPSRTPNHPEFKENRHDQAILTTLACREGIKLHEWYVKYEGYTPGRMTSYQQEFERPLFFHHRRRNHEWEQVA
jgi:hypothetical protein